MSALPPPSRPYNTVPLCLGFFALWLAGMAAIIYLNTAVWCLGDKKFDDGCGAWGLYYASWLAFTAPAAIAIFLAGVYKVTRASHRLILLTIGLSLTFVGVVVSWRLPWLDSPLGLLLSTLLPPAVTLTARTTLSSQ